MSFTLSFMPKHTERSSQGTAIFVPTINLTICYQEYHEKSILFPFRRRRADGLWFGETSSDRP